MIKSAARFSRSATSYPASGPNTMSAVAMASACMEEGLITVTEAKACVIGLPVRGLIVWEKCCPFLSKKFR